MRGKRPSSARSRSRSVESTEPDIWCISRERRGPDQRVDRYLHKDRIRPLFTDTVGGLEGTLRILEDRAASIWNWPWRREDKKAAVAEATTLLQEIVDLLKELEQRTSSGLCVNQLGKLERQLKESRPARPDIDQTINEIRACLDTYDYIDLRRRIVMQSELLLGAFPRAEVDPAITSALETD
jgi:hypothetical protein